MIKMNKNEVLNKIGKSRWKEFERVMVGQTVGINSDGLTNYYAYDVENFLKPKNKRSSD
ncbi:MAG: hypothetical protein WCX66_04750 [archaeon]